MSYSWLVSAVGGGIKGAGPGVPGAGCGPEEWVLFEMTTVEIACFRLTKSGMSDIMTDMKVTSRDFQRNFAAMKQKAISGEKVTILSDGQEFIFQTAKPQNWRGALKGRVKIKGDIFSAGAQWEAAK